MLDCGDIERVGTLLREAGETVRLARERAAAAEATARLAENGRTSAEERAKFAEERLEAALRSTEELANRVAVSKLCPVLARTARLPVSCSNR